MVGAASAAVLRDSTGLVIIAAISFHPFVDTILHEEYLVLLFGLEVVVANGHSCDEVESDSLMVIPMLRRGQILLIVLAISF